MAAPKSEHVLKKPPPSIIDGYKDASAGIDNIGHTSKNPRFKDRRYYALLEANTRKGSGRTGPPGRTMAYHQPSKCALSV